MTPLFQSLWAVRRIILVIPLAVLGVIAGSLVPRIALAQTEGYVPSSDGVELYYRVIGSSADTIVVLHGGPGLHMEYLAPDLEPLAAWYTLIFYDQRGGGRSTLISDSSRIHIDAHVADLEAVRRYFEIEEMVVLGHSWGAGLAARYALAHTDRLEALILAGPMAPRYEPHWAVFRDRRVAWRDDEVEARIAALIAQRDTTTDPQGLCRQVNAITIRGLFYDPHDDTVVNRMRGDLCARSEEARVNGGLVNRLTWASFENWDWRYDFGEVQVPVLIIHGADDPMPLESAEEWVDAFPNAVLVVLDRTGHYPHLEQPEAFVDAVRDFLR